MCWGCAWFALLTCVGPESSCTAWHKPLRAAHPAGLLPGLAQRWDLCAEFMGRNPVNNSGVQSITQFCASPRSHPSLHPSPHPLCPVQQLSSSQRISGTGEFWSNPAELQCPKWPCPLQLSWNLPFPTAPAAHSARPSAKGSISEPWQRLREFCGLVFHTLGAHEKD